MNIVPIDICFILILVIFIISACVKGFVKELFGKISVIASLALGVVFTPKLEVYVNKSIANTAVAKAISFLLIFVVVFLIVRILQHFVEKLFAGDIMKSLDRSLAIVLGLVEGLVVCTAVLFVLLNQNFFDASGLIEGSLFYSLLHGFIDNSQAYIGRISS